MNRRDFSLQLAGAGIGLAAAGTSRAQGAPVEGKQFVRLQTAATVATLPPGKKIEVIEFFWYGCQHCFAFEPIVQSWAKTLPPDVYFHQVPFGYLGPVEHQKMFYALEELGQREALQAKLFNAFHVQRARLNTEAEITAFVAANGVDGAKFAEAFKGFSVNTKVSRGKKLAGDYKIDSVPAVGIQGRYVTSASMAGDHERAVKVTDFLIQRARTGA